MKNDGQGRSQQTMLNILLILNELGEVKLDVAIAHIKIQTGLQWDTIFQQYLKPLLLTGLIQRTDNRTNIKISEKGIKFLEYEQDDSN